MKVIANNEEFECVKAIKDEVNGEVALYDEQGNEVFKAVGVSDFSGFEGEFTAPEKTEVETKAELFDKFSELLIEKGIVTEQELKAL